MKLNLFDLHCDTALSILEQNKGIDKNDLHISLENASVFKKYIQVMAIWCPKEYDNDKGFRNFHITLDHLLKSMDNSLFDVTLVRNADEISKTENIKNRFIISVEDARILNCEPDRLKVLHARGVRFLTLLWSGVTCIGGAYDTEVGLTDFGKDTVKQCFKLGIIPDVSHASVKSFYDVAEIANLTGGKPIVATHSDSSTVFSHKRNLDDKQFTYIAQNGGLVGINLCREHLGTSTNGVGLAVKNIEKYMSLGGEKCICLGCDLDGCDTPADIENISSLQKIAEKLASLNYTQQSIDDIFYNNAYNFAINNLK